MNVSNISELKQALKLKPDYILITDASLARNIKILKKAPKPLIIAILAASGFTVAMSWNPVGWTTGVLTSGLMVTASSSLTGAVVFLVSAIGVSLLWAVFNEWEIDVSAEGSMEGKGKVALKLRPRKKDS